MGANLWADLHAKFYSRLGKKLEKSMKLTSFSNKSMKKSGQSNVILKEQEVTWYFCEWKYLLFDIWIGDDMITQWTYKITFSFSYRMKAFCW